MSDICTSERRQVTLTTERHALFINLLFVPFSFQIVPFLRFQIMK